MNSASEHSHLIQKSNSPQQRTMIYIFYMTSLRLQKLLHTDPNWRILHKKKKNSLASDNAKQRGNRCDSLCLLACFAPLASSALRGSQLLIECYLLNLFVTCLGLECIISRRKFVCSIVFYHGDIIEQHNLLRLEFHFCYFWIKTW